MGNTKTNVGIGFVTGRRSFQKVLKTNIYNWRESGMTREESVRLNLLVVYDLKYKNTKPTDYTNVNKNLADLIDDQYFIGSPMIQKEIEYLMQNGVINEKEAKLFFGTGYAAKRNAALYIAMKNKIDYLLFLDDDEYPVAVTKTHSTAIWGGQHILKTHLQHIINADITNGHHCGYISPIPYIKFNDSMPEHVFRTFIEAISNDIINWETIRSVMDNGGVTYADVKVLTSDSAEDVQQINGAKFISGGNLCINLTDPTRVNPFYNPPGARGEDTFLSTCLADRKVLRVPCYAFHDGFSTYNHLMDGVLPISLKYIKADSEQITNRFYQACIGWIRYKPLLLYITNQEHYEEKIKVMREQIASSLPSVCTFFKSQDFMNISKEFELYNKNVRKHYQQFIETKHIWGKISEFIANQNSTSMDA